MLYNVNPNDLDEVARSRGMRCERPAPNELFVDIDSAEQLVRFDRAIVALKTVHPECTYTHAGSKTPGHYHVRVTMPHNVTPLERVAYQARLGSDPKREALALLRNRKGVRGEDLSVFFERKE